jgi:phage tail sheath gpL-like
MSNAIIIAGYTNSDKVPGAVRETKYGQGKVSIGEIPLKCVVTGNKTSAGSATADQDIVPIYSPDDADAYLGVGSEAALQCYAALEIPGVTLYAVPVLENGAGTAATLTITIAGTWSTTGTVSVFLMGKQIDAVVQAGDSVTTAAATLATAINGQSRFPMTATSALGVVTVLVRNKGTRGNDYICRKDLSAAPSGLTCTLAGGSALTNGMVPFSGGAGADDVTNVLALLATGIYDYQAWAQNDATNAGLIKAALISEAGPLLMHTEHAVMAKRGTQGTSTSFSQTTLNNQRMTCVHFENCEAPPSYIAAQVASLRSVIVGDNPNFRFDDYVLPTIPPQSQRQDVPTRSELNAMLNAGVMPLTTLPDGTVKIVRAIQSHSLNGSAPDFRTLDWGDADVPDRVSKELGAQWDVFSDANPYVGPDPADGEEPLPEGVGSPRLWNADVYKVLKDAEDSNWLQEVDQNLPVTEYNDDADRLMTAAPNVVRKQNHAVGISVRQTAA